MNISEYLASGIVELYAMNVLSPEEKTEFERHLVLYPELDIELKRTEKFLENYARIHALNPGPGVRPKIIKTVGFEGKDKKVAAVKKQLKSDTPQLLTYKYMIAASLAALVVSTFASWFFYMRWDESEAKHSGLLTEKNELMQNFNLVKSAYDETVSGLVIMRDENATIVTLKPADTTLHYQARIYCNGQTQRTYIDVLLLPEPAAGKQYQLWAFSNGKVIDAGVFSTRIAGLQRLKDIHEADLWFVTLEPQGGSFTPSADQKILVSKSKK
jgi:anti-sigma-K factor RskA